LQPTDKTVLLLLIIIQKINLNTMASINAGTTHAMKEEVPRPCQSRTAIGKLRPLKEPPQESERTAPPLKPATLTSPEPLSY
jgi:hypothetical protein